MRQSDATTSQRPPPAAELSDAALLERYLADRAEKDFAEIVRRHGPMVMGVCRRVLRDEHDAEDAFQATFVVLVRKAETIAPRGMLANWLYGVAHRTAVKARSMCARRWAREATMAQLPEPVAPPEPEGLWSELRPLLDRELIRLADKYRAPIVLCDLEGRTHQEAARELGWPVGTLSGRLSRARAQLARRLARQGVLLSAGSAVFVLSQQTASAHVPTALAASTVRAAALPTVESGVVSSNVSVLAEGVMRSMFLTKAKLVSAAVVVIGLACAGAALSSGGQQPEPKVDGKAAAVVENEKPAAPRQTETNARIRELLQERYETLKRYVELKEERYRTGNTTLSDVLRAKELLVGAELELADTDEQRLAVHAKAVELAKELERRVAIRVEIGGTPNFDPAELPAAKAHRLAAEIAYERAKARLARDR